MSKHWKWVLGIVAFCILAPIVSTEIPLAIRFQAEEGGDEVASHFLGALRRHDYAAAHTLMAPAEQTAVSVTAVQRAQELIEKKHGRWLSTATIDEHHANDALDHITFFYEVRVQSDEGMLVMVRVVRTDSGWRVLEYYYDDDPA